LAGLYPPRHPQIQRAQQAFLQAIQGCLEYQSALEYRFLGDLLIAGNRILPRESMMYRRFLEVCQTERKIGAIIFHAGATEPEIEALAEILGSGTGDDVATWAQRRGVTHIALEAPAKREEQTSEVMARRAYFGAVEMLRTVEAGILRREPVTVEQLSSLRVLTSAILDQILADPSLMLRLANIKSYDEYTLYHSVNVCVLSIGIGATLGLSEGDLRELAVAAILHDLGKITIPVEILHVPRARLQILRNFCFGELAVAVLIVQLEHLFEVRQLQTFARLSSGGPSVEVHDPVRDHRDRFHLIGEAPRPPQ